VTWTYNYLAGPKGGTLLALSDYCISVRVLTEGGPGKRGPNVGVQYLHGAHPVPHKFATERLVPLEVALRYTNSAGAVTHADGAAGHVFENLSEVKRLLRGQRGLATLRRTAPDMGTVELDVECAVDPQPSQGRHVYVFMLTAARPFWRSTTLQSATASPIAVGGDAPVDDAEIVFPATAVNPLFTHTPSGATVQVTGTIPTGGVRVFTETGQVKKESDSSDYSEFAVYNKPYILELDPGVSNAFTYSGGGTMTIYWRDKWG